MALQIEEAVDDSVGTQETLRLLGRTEAAHAPLSGSSRLVGKRRAVVHVAIGVVDRLRHQCPAGDTVAARLVGHELPGAGAVGPEQPSEELVGSRGVPARLQVYVDDVAGLVDA
jgi:hypothetical protein